MEKAIKETNYTFERQTSFYKGKVRDVYFFGDKIAIVATDRISAFDVILPEAIPYKGQVLNQLAAINLEEVRDIVPIWLEKSPHPNVSIGINCEAYPVEMVIRGYLAGHAWREYRKGKRHICGVELAEGLQENDKLPEPIITPTTKAAQGHDEDISREEIIQQGLISEEEYQELEEYTRQLFERGSQLAKKRGLILVDTKYEFGRYKDSIYLIDEVHTPDSSRFFYSEGYEQRQKENQKQRQLSKEFVREWLMTHGFQGQEGQAVPPMDAEVIASISGRYIELYEKMTDAQFVRRSTEHLQQEIENSIKASI